MDAYRLSGAEDAFNLDIDQFFTSGPLVIEWPGQIKGALPEFYLWVDLVWVDEFQRRMVFKPKGQHYKDLLNEFRQKSFGG
jgi:tRNA A37 threonylcarbamoyladenosine biosynthesis protein TsaE